MLPQVPDATALPVCEKEMAEKESWRVEFLMSGKEYSQSEDAEEHVSDGGWSVQKKMRVTFMNKAIIAMSVKCF
jgi:hypothetical protein